jgi:ATP-dependent DNA helicase RecQ
VLLAYFSEDSGPCGNCDVCLNPPVTEDASPLARHALACVVQTGQRFGAAQIIDVLRGADTEKVRGLGHDRLAAHGLGRGEAKETWRSLLRQLVAADFLRLDVAGHGGLSLTEAGRALLDGRGDFRFRRDTAGAGGTRGRSGRAPADAELSGADERLYAALKELRLEFARERGVPAYVIFRDRSLVEMARARPADQAEFAQVFGVGEAKVRDFAQPFLALIARVADDREPPRDIAV